MKKLLILFAILVIATAVRDVIGYFGSMASAFRAYRAQATETAMARGKSAPFADVEGHIVDVAYHLETAEQDGDNRVRLVVVEAIQFQRMSEMLQPLGNRRIARTEQQVLMSRVDGEWVVSEIAAGATEVVELSEVVPSSP